MALVKGTSASELIDANDGVTSGNDQIFGYGGVDEIFGLGGNDVIKGGAGADTIDGGSGIDYVEYTDSLVGVEVSLALGTGLYGTADGDTFYNIENVRGSNYDDTLTGNHLANVLSGLNGDDTLYGLAGDDTLLGGDGIDHLYGAADDDELNGGAGGDFLYGEADDDTLYGWTGNDTLDGGDGTDTLDGGAGIDQMTGGVGDDSYFVDSHDDVVIELAGQGTDVVYSLDHYILTPHVETLLLLEGGAIFAIGNDQANTIYGNSGNNWLEGRGGVDTLVGMGGFDYFVFDAGQSHLDTVFGFVGMGTAIGDVLRFEGYGTQTDGASFVHLTGDNWQINSADGTHHETIILVGVTNPLDVDPSDLMFV